MKNQLIFLGAPGSGKGTQASNLVEKYKLKHLSTGDVLRSEIKKNSDLGKRVSSILSSGNLVDDTTMLELLCANCNLAQATYIFDGFPRTFEQAVSLENNVLTGRSFLAVLFDLDPEIVISRLTNRRICRGCSSIYNIKTAPPKKVGICDKCSSTDIYQREDDKEEVIRNRIEVYNKGIAPVLKYYEQKGVLKRLDATKDPLHVFNELEAILF